MHPPHARRRPVAFAQKATGRRRQQGRVPRDAGAGYGSCSMEMPAMRAITRTTWHE